MDAIKSLSSWKKQILYFFIISVFGSVAGIAHGVFFVLEWDQIGRISFFGVIFPPILVFRALLLFE
mgnify:CR=1 FL=1